MKFKDFKDKNFANYNFFEADELSYKGFIKLAFERFLAKEPFAAWRLDLDNKSLNSYPNFTQRHQICISNKEFESAVFQFRISSENSVNSLGYRLFINLDGAHKDFVASDITQTDKVVMEIKNEILKEFGCISKCGWWITDIWRDLHPITDDSDSEDFVSNLTNHDFTKEMIKINETLLSAQNDGRFDKFIKELKRQK